MFSFRFREIEDIPLKSGEVILPIQGYEGLYSITSFGKVWSHEKMRGNGRRYRGKYMKFSMNKDGYLYTCLKYGEIVKSIKPHILVATHYIPNPQNLPEVNHKDGNKLNCRKDNLEWCTHDYNTKHAMENGLIKKVSSEYYGVYLYRGREYRKCPWRVKVTDGRQIQIGSYATEIEAAKAYNNYVVKHNLNRPLNEIRV